jgi:DNA polymerase II small subunit
MNPEVMKTIRERGLLLEKEIYDLVNSLESVDVARSLLMNLERISGQKIITKTTLSKNVEFVHNFFLGKGDTTTAQRIFIKLGLSVEVTKHREEDIKKPLDTHNFKIFYSETKPDKKLEVGDFVGHFRARYQQLQKILMQRPDLQNLVSINKISGNRQQIDIIGAVIEKRHTKNKNLMVKFEDSTGIINILFRADKVDLTVKANELQLDDIVAVKCTGSSEMLFANEIYYPDAYIQEKIKFNEDYNIAFISDVHCGSDRHLEKSFERFLEWINSDNEDARKIKYLFIVGDNIDGVGVFPGQERVLKLKSMKKQYEMLASYLERIPKRVIMFMCPGQHDASRVAEPQPIIDRKYSEPLYNIENLILVTNPTMVKLIEENKEFKVLMYHGASIHNFISEIPELREMKAHKCPAKAVKHMLKRRHLAPTHSDAIYIPNADKDPMVIQEVPDVLCTGEVHRLDIENYNGVLIITGSCWQAQTPFEEKVGNIPDPAKVPVLNLKTRELKVYDFGIEEEINREY